MNAIATGDNTPATDEGFWNVQEPIGAHLKIDRLECYAHLRRQFGPVPCPTAFAELFPEIAASVAAFSQLPIVDRYRRLRATIDAAEQEAGALDDRRRDAESRLVEVAKANPTGDEFAVAQRELETLSQARTAKLATLATLRNAAAELWDEIEREYTGTAGEVAEGMKATIMADRSNCLEEFAQAVSPFLDRLAVAAEKFRRLNPNMFPPLATAIGMESSKTMVRPASAPRSISDSVAPAGRTHQPEQQAAAAVA